MVYGLVFGISSVIFAYLATKSTKAYYQLLFAISSIFSATFIGAVILTPTASDLGFAFYHMILIILQLTLTIFVIETIYKLLTMRKNTKMEAI